MGRMITEAELRENLSAILEEASRTGDGITIRREDGPDIQLRPVDDLAATSTAEPRPMAKHPLHGMHKGSVVILGDIISPMTDDWGPLVTDEN